MEISHSAFGEIIAARGVDVATLSKRTGIARPALASALERDADFPDYQIEVLAEQLAVPPAMLFARAPLQLIPSIDFRVTTPGVGEFEVGTLKAIRFVENFSSVLAALEITPQIDVEIANFQPTDLTKSEAGRLAKYWRLRWGITNEEQTEWRDANKVYKSLRNFIESLGIIVIHRSFSTIESSGIYLRSDSGPHVIVINTYHSSKARKVFTLGHEFGHVLLGKQGASNASVIKNKIEQFCNWFSARLLAPKDLINYAIERYDALPEPSDRFIRLFAQKIGISQEATFLRLVELGHLERDSYEAWKAKFGNRFHIPAGDLGENSGGGQSDPVQNKITQFGTTLLTTLASARKLGLLDEFEIQQISGLKPRFQEALFGEA